MPGPLEDLRAMKLEEGGREKDGRRKEVLFDEKRFIPLEDLRAMKLEEGEREKDGRRKEVLFDDKRFITKEMARKDRGMLQVGYRRGGVEG